MAARAYWKGSLKLSLVSCPVLLYPASTASDKTRFHMINKETGNRLKQQMVDAETGDVVENDQKARGYELKKGEYVEIDKEELEAVQIESNHTIDIDSFVPKDEIDKRYLNHPYYIAPDGKAGIDAFAVIRDAMKDQDRVALARIVLTNREHVIAIEPLGKGLLGTTLRYPYELRDEDDYFDDIKNPKISKDMVELAGHILDTKAAHFDPSKFRDEYETALKTLVKRKAAGKPVKAAEPEEKPDNVISLMDALKQSLKGRASAKRHAAGAAGIAPHGQKSAPLGGARPQGGVKATLSPPSLRARRSNPPRFLRARAMDRIRCELSMTCDVDGLDKLGHDEYCSEGATSCALRFFAVFFFDAFFGTFAPAALASDRPIAIACLRLLTVRPDRPLFSVPALRFFIARSTLAADFFEYFRAEIFVP